MDNCTLLKLFDVYFSSSRFFIVFLFYLYNDLSWEDLAEDNAGELDEELFELVTVLVFRLSCLAFFIMSFNLLSALIICIVGVTLDTLSAQINLKMKFNITK